MLDKIEFFGAVDRKDKRPDGLRSSEIPAWYLDAHIGELDREIESYEGMIRNGGIPNTEVPKAKAELVKLRGRKEEIVKSKPKLSAKEKDEVANIYKELGQEISDSMFSRSEMNKGLVSAHDEARRMSQPIISVGNKGKVFEKMGVKVIKGKMSRNDASRVWKITGKLLGEPTNVEYLRKDFNNGTYHSDRTLAEVEAGI